MIIDCKECEMYESDHCKDCFVMAVLSRKKSETTLVIDPEMEEAITNLQQSGLAPVIKFRRKAG
jgi:hypothetical protein